MTIAGRDLAEPELEIRLGRRPRLRQVVPERLRPAQSGPERQFLPRDLLDRLSDRPGRPRLFRPARLLVPGHGEFRLPAAARRRLADAGTITRPSISPRKRPTGSAARSTIDANLTSSSAALASYQQVGADLARQSIWPVSRLRESGRPARPTYNPGSCLLRGIGGDYTPAAQSNCPGSASIIDPIGEVWTPFAFARANGNYLDYQPPARRPLVVSGITIRHNRQRQPEQFPRHNNQVRRLRHAGRRPRMALSAADARRRSARW